MALLSAAEQLSNNLAILETQAMETIKQKKYVKGPAAILPGESPQEFAIRILYDDNYHREVEKIMEPIDMFCRILEDRMNTATKQALRISNRYLNIVSVFIALTAVSILFFVFFLSIAVIRPILKTSEVFSYLSSGDLRKQMEVRSSNEIGKMASDFNTMMKKIKGLIFSIQKDTTDLSELGTKLAENMHETAAAIHQISMNIDGVKQQAMTQAASVNETASTVTDIIRIIKQLSGNRENQAVSVAKSSSAIEQMVANIASITDTLEKTDSVIKTLAAATADGKETIVSSHTVTQKIAEEVWRSIGSVEYYSAHCKSNQSAGNECRYRGCSCRRSRKGLCGCCG